jgi:death-on-curing protein
MSPIFLHLEDVLALHARSIELFGGSLGVRDIGLLQSALAVPEASCAGELLHPTIHEMAAAYLFHLCKNHPFLDGNKRAATAAALVFLEINGWSLDAPDPAAHAACVRERPPLGEVAPGHQAACHFV